MADYKIEGTELEKVLTEMNVPVDEKAVVVLSGGQDSTTCLYWAMKKFKGVIAVTFNYGQRNSEEVEIAQTICEEEGIPNMVIQIQDMHKISSSALLNFFGDLNVETRVGLPSYFISNRNQLFLTYAHSFAQVMGATHIVFGAWDYVRGLHPDCSRKFIDSVEASLNIGSHTEIKIHTPVIYLKKAEMFVLVDMLGRLDTVLNNTLTCHEGVVHLNDWGMGCGECDVCLIRKSGYEEYLSMKTKSENGKESKI